MIIILKVILDEWWVKYIDPLIRLCCSTVTKWEKENKLFMAVRGGDHVWSFPERSALFI